MKIHLLTVSNKCSFTCICEWIMTKKRIESMVRSIYCGGIAIIHCTPHASKKSKVGMITYLLYILTKVLLTQGKASIQGTTFLPRVSAPPSPQPSKKDRWRVLTRCCLACHPTSCPSRCASDRLWCLFPCSAPWKGRHALPSRLEECKTNGNLENTSRHCKTKEKTFLQKL